MIPAADLLEGLDGPAAVADADGGLLAANLAFTTLSLPQSMAALSGGHPDWRERVLPSGARLVQADRRQAGFMRRADVLATLSHELRTPLNGVLGMTGLLEGTRLDASQRAYLATVRQCGEHLLELVGSVLDWARLDAGKIELEAGRTELEPLLQGVAELLAPQAQAKGLEIAWAVEGDIAAVTTDDGRLRQILFNLAGNAVKMTATGGVRLIARATPTADGRAQLTLSVADTGPGLSREAQSRIFEPFEQTKEGVSAGGAGLGLAIVRRLAEALGGAVTVESRPGAGAVFTLEMTAPIADAPSTSEPVLARRGVAVVSPSAVVRQAAAMQVEALGGRPILLEDLEALKTSHEPIDLVLYDVPASRRLSTAPKGPPVLVMLAPDGRGRIPALKARGYAGYLIKPLRRVSLAARAEAALAGAADDVQAARDDDRLAPDEPAMGLRVLLAEDNPVNARLASILLQREGCRVTAVTTGEEAVEAAEAERFDLILLDLRMPDMDGLTAAKALRRKGVKAIIAALTANAFDEDRRSCMAAGMDGFLTKPLDREALHALLARFRPSKAA